MPFTEKRLAGPRGDFGGYAYVFYTVPSQITTILKQLIVTNTTGSSATFSIYITTQGNYLFYNTPVSANDTLVINMSQVMTSGESLYVTCDPQYALVFTLSGVENNGPLDPATVYIADGAITTSRLANASVTSAKLAANSVGTTAIVDGSITTDKLAANAVATVDIANNAVTQAKLSTDVPLSGMRNVLINGDFRVWQRGTGPSNISTGYGTGYLADRWIGARGGYDTGGTVSRQLASLEGFQYCSRVQRTSGNTSTSIFYYYQNIETVNSIPLASKTVTYSFYARAGSNFSGTIIARLLGGTATDQTAYPDASITGQSIIISSSFSPTTSWQRFILSGTVGSSVTQLFNGFEWTPSGTAGTNDYFEITGVQLESGSQVTPFEQRPYGLEFSMCERYFQRIQTPKGIGTGIVYSDATATALSILPTKMRVTPSVSNSGIFATIDYQGIGRGVNITSVTAYDDRLVYTLNSVFNQSGGQGLYFWGSNGADVQIKAELS